MDEETIAAIATPPGPGGIGIIRISGDRAPSIMESLFRPFRNHKRGAEGPLPSLPRIESHKLYYGYVVDPSTQIVVDEVLCVLMKAPRSYTREDVVEIQCHSGRAVLNKILEMVIQLGARLATPGEFTKRAFLNGRIDLIQAEAILDLASAKTSSQHSAAVALLSGALGERISQLRDLVLQCLAQIEVCIDYPDEEIPLFDPMAMAERLQREAFPIFKALIDGYRHGHLAREGAKVVLAGRPNVGKSSLFNALLGTERVIVSDVPGTTRDRIEELVDVKGLPALLVDTAGLRDHTSDAIEHLGIQMAWDQLQSADLVVFVVDATQQPSAEELEILASLKRDKKVVTVLNKCDLPNAVEIESWEQTVQDGIKASCKTGTGIDAIKARIFQSLVGEKGEVPSLIPNLRQKGLLEAAQAHLVKATEAMRGGLPAEIVALELRDALGHLDEITGRKATDDLLDTIFSNFCLGK